MEILWQKPLKYSVVDALFLFMSWMPATAPTGSPMTQMILYSYAQFSVYLFSCEICALISVRADDGAARRRQQTTRTQDIAPSRTWWV